MDEPIADDGAGQPADDAHQGVAIPMGRAMPDVAGVPVLTEAPVELPAALPVGGPSGHSKIGEGLSFTGSALIRGAVTVAGEVQGDLVVQPDSGEGAVTITETGTVVGDIRAQNISVLGATIGTLDAGGGKVTLHETASVAGKIRYSHLQVNGADLNAQLERVRPDGQEPAKR
jgi:cytoskeletal protein CcmA (bactofilin family)